MEWGITIFGLISLALGLIATGIVAAYVYRLQHSEQQALETTVGRIDEAVRQIAEKLAEADNQEVDADSAPIPGEPTAVHAAEPANVNEYIQDLKARGAHLDFTKLRWSKKVRADGDGRGNLGWFVDDGVKRYFIHRGKRTLVRPAIPRALLSVWESETGLNPQEIELDYQIGTGRGSHSWFIRTYAGDTWRIGQGGGRVTVAPLDSSADTD